MYLPTSFAERDIPTIHAFIEAHSPAALVTGTPTEGLLATHLPMVLDRSIGPMGTLFGHLARANPHSRCFSDEPVEAMVIFTGPNTYITPQWYQTKQETGKVVPTWNYVAVHAYGALRTRDDPEFLRGHLEALTLKHESSRGSSWHVSDAPDEFIAQQMKAIICVEFRIERLEGKWKMSQNRPEADIDGVIKGLGESPLERDHDVAAIVEERRPKPN